MKIRSWLPSKWRLEKEPQKTVKNNGTYRKWNRKWEPKRGYFLFIWLLFSVPDSLGSPNGSQGLPQEPPRPVQASISMDFGLIWEVFFVIFCIMWVTYFLCGLPHYFFDDVELSFSNFWPQVRMRWGRP